MSVHWAQSSWTGQCDHFLSCIIVGESRWQPMVSFWTFLMRMLTPLWFSRFVAKFSLQCNPFPLMFSLRGSSTSLFLFSLTYLNIASQHWWNRGQCYLHLGRVPQVPNELNPQITICRQISQAICHTELNSFQARTLIHKCTKFQSRMFMLVWILQFLIFLKCPNQLLNYWQLEINCGGIMHKMGMRASSKPHLSPQEFLLTLPCARLCPLLFGWGPKDVEEGQSLKALLEIRKDSPRHCHTLFTVLFCQLIPSSRLKINARERLLFHFTGKLANKKKIEKYLKSRAFYIAIVILEGKSLQACLLCYVKETGRPEWLILALL